MKNSRKIPAVASAVLLACALAFAPHFFRENVSAPAFSREEENRVSADAPEFFAKSAPLGTIPGELVLAFDSEENFRAFLADAKRRGLQIRGEIAQLRAVRISSADSASVSEIAKKLPRGAAFSDFNYAISLPPPSEISPGGKSAGDLAVGENALAMMGVSAENSARTLAGAGVLVAILDGGISASHPALAGVSVSVADVAKGAPDSAESLAHGTAVASLVAGNGADGVFGLAPNCEILSVRVFDGLGRGDAFTLAAGLVSAVEAGAQVVNISAGVFADSAVLRNAVEFALGRGVAIVAAAGNEGVSALAFPAAYPGVVSVGAVDGAGTRAPFSNVGEGLAVVAPGVGVSAASVFAGEGENCAAPFSGTSASAPLVAGLVAAAISDSRASSGEIFDVLAGTSDDLGAPGADSEYGAGIVDFERVSRAAGAVVGDLRVSDFYVKSASGGRANPSLTVGVQNRGTVWSSGVVLSVRLSFADGRVSVFAAEVGALPANASAGVELDLPAGTLENGVRADAELADKSGASLDSASATLRVCE